MEAELDTLCKNIVTMHREGKPAKKAIQGAQEHLNVMNKKLISFYDLVRKDKSIKKIVSKANLLEKILDIKRKMGPYYSIITELLKGTVSNEKLAKLLSLSYSSSVKNSSLAKKLEQKVQRNIGYIASIEEKIEKITKEKTEIYQKLHKEANVEALEHF